MLLELLWSDCSGKTGAFFDATTNGMSQPREHRQSSRKLGAMMLQAIRSIS